MTMRSLLALGPVALTVAASLACTPPPPAPEGLDASTSYMMRNFYADDATFGAGIQGFLDWFEDEGYQLLGVTPVLPGQADDENERETNAFTMSELSPEDVALLPLDPMIAETVDGEGNEVLQKRDLSMAKGVVSLAEMDCSYERTHNLLTRKDQNNVFALDWDGYERSYQTPVKTFSDAMKAEDFTPITEDLNPFAEGFDFAAFGKSILFTDNIVDPAPVEFGINMPEYPLELDIRHGVYDLEFAKADGGTVVETTRVFAIITYNRKAVYDEGFRNGLRQSFSIEINVERPNGKTLRMLGVWAEPVGAGLAPDNPILLNAAVGKSLASSDRMSKVCSGEIEID